MKEYFKLYWKNFKMFLFGMLVVITCCSFVAGIGVGLFYLERKLETIPFFIILFGFFLVLAPALFAIDDYKNKKIADRKASRPTPKFILNEIKGRRTPKDAK